MNHELREAELKYTNKFKEAETIPDETERRTKLEGLRNSFGTKQSMIRKKYGVRLRERRTKAEIQAERERMGLKGSGGTPRASVPARRSYGEAELSAASTPTPAAKASAGWTVANNPILSSNGGGHDEKRRRLDDGFDKGDTPSRPRTPAVETASPRTTTLKEVPSHASSNETLPPLSSLATHGQTTSDADTRLPAINPPAATATISPPRNVIDAKRVPILQDDDDSSDDDDEDIPARLPATVRQSLPSSTVGLGA